MQNNWRKVSLGDLQKEGLAHIQTGPFGTVLKASEYSDQGVPVISVGEIREGYLKIHDHTPKVSEDTVNRLPQFVLEAGDIVFGRKGAINRNSIVNAEQSGWFLGSDGIRLRMSPEINSVFVSYTFRSPAVGRWLLQNSSGSIMPSLNQKTLDRLPVWLPEREVQDAIASLLSSIDQKIELNNRINAELEAMAKTLYDYWFVQFDFPDANGKPYKTSGGKMVYNPVLKREIPEGWNDCLLGDHLTFKRGISYKSGDIQDAGVPFINLNSFSLSGEFKLEGTKYYNGKFKLESKLNPGELVIAITDVTRNADIIGKAFVIPDIFDETPLMSCDVASVFSRKFCNAYLEQLFNSESYHKYIKYYASGTLVLHLDLNGVKWFKTYQPPQKLLEEYSQHCTSLFKQRDIVLKENVYLESLRDWLLPMLMNGQVTVR